MATPRKCLGFQANEGKCKNIAGTRWGPYLCPECDKRRLAHLDGRMKELERQFNVRADKAVGD